MFHRHNRKVQGAEFSIGLLEGRELIGVAIAGRPVARHLDNGKTIEILRVCVKEGHPNANSRLYGRTKRICQLMGYEKVITYTLTRESGNSLKGIGARPVSEVTAKNWDRMKRHRKDQKIYGEAKTRWEL